MNERVRDKNTDTLTLITCNEFINANHTHLGGPDIYVYEMECGRSRQSVRETVRQPGYKAGQHRLGQDSG